MRFAEPSLESLLFGLAGNHSSKKLLIIDVLPFVMTVDRHWLLGISVDVLVVGGRSLVIPGYIFLRLDRWNCKLEESWEIGLRMSEFRSLYG